MSISYILPIFSRLSLMAFAMRAKLFFLFSIDKHD